MTATNEAGVSVRLAHKQISETAHSLNEIKLKGQQNTELANQLIQNMSETEVIGPIQMGLNKPIHFTDIESSVRDIVNITAIACFDAIDDKKKKAQ